MVFYQPTDYIVDMLNEHTNYFKIKLNLSKFEAKECAIGFAANLPLSRTAQPTLAGSGLLKLEEIVAPLRGQAIDSVKENAGPFGQGDAAVVRQLDETIAEALRTEEGRLILEGMTQA